MKNYEVFQNHEIDSCELFSEPYVLYKPSGSEYFLNNSNYTLILVPSDNFVNIQGTLILNADYEGLNSNRLVIEGGTISGNDSYILNLGNDCVITGTTFKNVDINCNRATFINCVFTGNCLRIGNSSKYYDSEFTGLNIGCNYIFGVAFNSKFQKCTIPLASEIINSDIVNCIIGNGRANQRAIKNISGCFLSETIVYALQSDFSFDKNRCISSKIKIGDAFSSPQNIIISNNIFQNIITGANEIIEINPQYTGNKIFNIKDNSFLMQNSNPCAIAITSNDGNNSGNSLLNIQGNTFRHGESVLLCNTDMKIYYYQNIAFSVSNPASSGNLTADKNYDF